MKNLRSVIGLSLCIGIILNAPGAGCWAAMGEIIRAPSQISARTEFQNPNSGAYAQNQIVSHDNLNPTQLTLPISKIDQENIGLSHSAAQADLPIAAESSEIEPEPSDAAIAENQTSRLGIHASKVEQTLESMESSGSKSENINKDKSGSSYLFDGNKKTQGYVDAALSGPLETASNGLAPATRAPWLNRFYVAAVGGGHYAHVTTTTGQFSLRDALGYAALAAGLLGLGALMHRINSSPTIQKYLAKRWWITTHPKTKWKDASPEAKAAVEAEGEREAAASRNGRAKWSDFFKLGRSQSTNKNASQSRVLSSEKSAPISNNDYLWGDTSDDAKRSPEGEEKKDSENTVADSTRFSDIEGQEETIEKLRTIAEFIQNPDRFLKLGAKGIKAALLYGPPGTGKTALAWATANEAGVPMVVKYGSSFVRMYVGSGSNGVESAFAEARAKAAKAGKPCILFIDELDAVGKTRSGDSTNQEYGMTTNELLAQMSDPKNKDVILIATTNRPETLDSALTRGGRFGLKIPVGKPDVNARQKIFQKHIQKRNMPLAANVNLRKLAEETPGLAGGDIEEIVNEAGMQAAARNGKDVQMQDFEKAINDFTNGHEQHNRIIPKEELRIIAYHEGGHALVAHLLPNADPVAKITVVPHGLNALGFMQTLSKEEHMFYSRSWLIDRIAVALGGRAAEEMMTGDIYNGAQNDFEAATSIALSMVAKWGMSGKLGLGVYDMPGEAPKTGRAVTPDQAKLINAEVNRLIQEGYTRAKEILAANKAVLEKLKDELLLKETLHHEDLERLIPGVKRPKS